MTISVCIGGSSHHEDPPPRSAQVQIESSVAELPKFGYVGSVDVVEICDGERGVGKLCVRRRLKRGAKFDLVTGVDLGGKSFQDEAIRHLEANKPSVIILAAPCTFFWHWSHFNRAMHPATWSQSGAIGESSLEFAAERCKLQINACRHFILEDPVGPGIFPLACFKALCDSWQSGQRQRSTMRIRFEG